MIWKVSKCVNDGNEEMVSWMVIHQTTRRSFTCETSSEAYAVCAALNKNEIAECYE